MARKDESVRVGGKKLILFTKCLLTAWSQILVRVCCASTVTRLTVTSPSIRAGDDTDPPVVTYYNPLT